MVAIVRSFDIPASELEKLSKIPSVDEMRPPQCKLCGAAAGVPGVLSLIGHGLYQRQVRGLLDAPEGVSILVRRFLCLACRRTTSVLPDEVHPRRWYAGAAILIALARYLILGWSAEKVRDSIGAAPGTRGWKAVERWTKQLLDSLWFWKASELGYRSGSGSLDRDEAKRRLCGLLLQQNLHVPEPKPPDIAVGAFDSVARNLVRGTVHAWPDRELISRTS